MKLLHIIASPRGEKSRTLNVSNQFLDSLKTTHPDLSVEELDLFKVKLPEVLADAVEAKYTLMGGGTLNEDSKSSWQEIAKLSNDFLSYDAYLISSPMWNFTIPYKLKHYIDIIMQAGILFAYSEKGVEGLAKDKKMFCVTSRGSDYSEGTHMHQFDFQEPYLRSIFGFAGITDITFLNAQPLDFAPAITEASIAKAKEEAVLMASNGVA